MADPVYTTADKVAIELGFASGYFTTTSTPKLAEINNIINRIEDRIDNRTGHAWRAKSVSDEYVRPSSVYRYGTGVQFELIHRSIQSVSKIEVWNGNEWEDWITDKTEGRNADYWIDETNGTVFLNNITRIYPRGIRISYVYGETAVTGGIEDCATMMAALKVLNIPEFSVVLFSQVGENKQNWDSNKKEWERQIEDILGNNQEFQ